MSFSLSPSRSRYAPCPMESLAFACRPLPPLPTRAAAAPVRPTAVFSRRLSLPTSVNCGGRHPPRPSGRPAIRLFGRPFRLHSPHEGLRRLVEVRKRRSWGHLREYPAAGGGVGAPERSAHSDEVLDEYTLLEGLRRGYRVPAAACAQAVGEARGQSLA